VTGVREANLGPILVFFFPNLYGLPFAVAPMFRNLGVAWLVPLGSDSSCNFELTLAYRCRACSTLGFIALVLGAFPFVFYIYGPKLRARSTLIESFD
jgi:hypothetical protein